MAQELISPGGTVSYYDGSFTILQLQTAATAPITLMPFRTGFYPIFFGLTLSMHLTGMGLPMQLTVRSNFQYGTTAQTISQLDVPNPSFARVIYNIFPNAYGLFFDSPVYNDPTDNRNYLQLAVGTDDASIAGVDPIRYRLFYSLYN